MSQAGQRRMAREFALRILYSNDLQASAGLEDQPMQPVNWWREEDRLSITHEAEQFARNLAYGVLARLGEIDALIQQTAKRWKLERISPVERNILRLAMHELISDSDMPPSVVLDEAVELAKCYGDVESSAFVNGVLDHAAKSLGERAESA